MLALLRRPKVCMAVLDYYLDCDAKVGIVMFPSKHYHINCYTIFFYLIINEIRTYTARQIMLTKALPTVY